MYRAGIFNILTAGLWIFQNLRYMLKDLFEETWKELKSGATEKSHPFDVCCLATLENSENTRQRIVKLREVTSANTLLFYTDSRSSKIEQIKQNPTSSGLFYNPAIKLQILVSGKILLHTDDELWQDHRQKIDGRAINDYNTKSPPGKPIKNPVEVTRSRDINFALLELIPDSIEYLKLRAEPNRMRALFTKTADNWDKTFLIP